jgi:omega-6 fatty acid desaturase (delta-12 desaturase)
VLRISSRIPSYNLRKAYASLQENWDKHLNKAEFGVPLMTTIVTECNLFDDKKKRWVKFDKASRDAAVAARDASVVSAGN